MNASINIGATAIANVYLGNERLTSVCAGATPLWSAPAVVYGPAVAVSSSNGGAQGTNTVSIAAPANITAGNLLYAVAGYDNLDNTAALTCDGWTSHASLRYSTNNNSGFLHTLFKIATASEPASYTFSGGNIDALNVGIIQLSGINPSNPFGNVVPTQQKNASSTSAKYPSITTPSQGSILVLAAQGGAYSGAVSTSLTPGTGYTEAVASTSQYKGYSNVESQCLFADLSGSLAAGTYTPPSGTFSKAYTNGTMAVFLKG